MEKLLRVRTPFCPHESCLLSVCKAARQGIVYGVRIRFPHALVMSTMRSGTIADKARTVCMLTINHAKGLSLFAVIYKGVTCLLRHAFGTDSLAWTMIGGFIGGALIFGGETAVNQQIVLYLFSRVATAIGRVLVRKGLVPAMSHRLFAAICWMLAVLLFEYDRSALQNSLAGSMQYLYKDSDKWTNWRDFFI
mmetsp:Transcript_19309/g.31620  ORF Transcript_19309/g.31620 Transcript_19309/m.31620 type:complete len:193 (+) Transcript_19309:133-711(+)